MFKPKITRGFFLGALVGAISTFFLSPRSGKANRKYIEQKIKSLDTKLRDPKIAEEIQKILMKISNDAPAKYVIIKKELNNSLQKAKEKFEKIEYEKYSEIIENVIKKVVGENIIKNKSILYLRSKLISLWNDEKKVKKKVHIIKKRKKLSIKKKNMG